MASFEEMLKIAREDIERVKRKPQRKDYNKERYERLKQDPKAFAEWQEKMKAYKKAKKAKLKAATVS